MLALPFFRIVTEVVPAFSRKPVLGYPTMAFATLSITALSTPVWTPQMYATGQVLLPFVALLSMLIAIPTGLKFFN